MKRGFMTKAEFEALSLIALSTYVTSERNIVDRAQAELSKRQRALARATRVLKTKRKAA